MNYEKHFLAFCIPGETGNGIIVTSQDKSQVKGLKIFAGGNVNVEIPKKLFKQMITRGHLEVIDKVPSDVFKDVHLTWKNNQEKLDSGSDIG